jgi:hypothetical protein
MTGTEYTENGIFLSHLISGTSGQEAGIVWEGVLLDIWNFVQIISGCESTSIQLFIEFQDLGLMQERNHYRKVELLKFWETVILNSVKVQKKSEKISICRIPYLQYSWVM